VKLPTSFYWSANMAVRKEEYPLEKVILNLRKGDFKWLQYMHPKEGAAKQIRKIVIRYRERVEKKIEERQAASKDELELNLEEIL